MSNMSDWDRSKQNYFIRAGKHTWKVLKMKGQESVCEFPVGCLADKDIDQICFAQDDDEVKKVVSEMDMDGKNREIVKIVERALDELRKNRQ